MQDAPAGSDGRGPCSPWARSWSRLAILVSFSSPRLADRTERNSTRELVAGDTEGARDEALWARVFNPLAPEPFFALARVAERQGRVLRAEREYINAIELQPENPETWYTAGIFEFQVRDNMCAAYRYLNEAYTRDPVGNQWVDGGALDVARMPSTRAAARRAPDRGEYRSSSVVGRSKIRRQLVPCEPARGRSPRRDRRPARASPAALPCSTRR